MNSTNWTTITITAGKYEKQILLEFVKCLRNESLKLGSKELEKLIVEGRLPGRATCTLKNGAAPWLPPTTYEGAPEVVLKDVDADGITDFGLKEVIKEYVNKFAGAGRSSVIIEDADEWMRGINTEFRKYMKNTLEKTCREKGLKLRHQNNYKDNPCPLKVKNPGDCPIKTA